MPVAGATRAKELANFQGAAEEDEKCHGGAESAAAEALQSGEGGEHGVRGEVLDLVVDVCAVDEANDGALRGGEATDDDRGERDEPEEAEESHLFRLESPDGVLGHEAYGPGYVIEREENAREASALKFHQSNGSRQDNALLALRKDSRVLRHSRASADCFGANPVASALGDRARRDPSTAVRTYHEGLKPTRRTGTLYLAGNRNFLFGSDSRGLSRRSRPCR